MQFSPDLFCVFAAFRGQNFPRRCTRLIECLPLLQHDPTRPEDILKVDPDDDGIGGDDAADAFRYLVSTRAWKVESIKLRGI